MKTGIKIAIISAIATVLATVITVVIPIVFKQNDKNGPSEKTIVTTSSEYHQTGNISIEESKNAIVGNITTAKGDVIIGGTKTTNMQPLSEGQDDETK